VWVLIARMREEDYFSARGRLGGHGLRCNVETKLPTMTTRRLRFGKLALVLACIPWSAIIVGWIFVLLRVLPSLRTPSDNQDYYGAANRIVGFFGMIVGTVVLFFAGVLVLAIAAIVYRIRSRRYRLEQQALEVSQSIPPPPPPLEQVGL
jgi:hypothetical protein